MVKGIRAGSAAETAGLSVGDEIIAADGIRVNNSAVESYVGSLGEGETCKLLIARDDVLLELTVQMTLYERPSFKLEQISFLLSYLLTYHLVYFRKNEVFAASFSSAEQVLFSLQGLVCFVFFQLHL